MLEVSGREGVDIIHDLSKHGDSAPWQVKELERLLIFSDARPEVDLSNITIHEILEVLCGPTEVTELKSMSFSLSSKEPTSGLNLATLSSKLTILVTESSSSSLDSSVAFIPLFLLFI